MIKQVKIVFIISMCFEFLNSTLKVIETPSGINNQNELLNFIFTYTIGNFGDVPYGKRMTAKLLISEPFNACNKINQTKVIPLDSKTPFFLLIERGECTFSQKAINALAIGSSVAIIIDNLQEVSEQITMGDDGSGLRVSIPALFINKNEGQLLFDAALYAKQQNQSDSLQLKIDFNTQKSKTVNVKFFLNIDDRTSYIMLKEFNNLRSYLQDQITIDIVYRFYVYLPNQDQIINCLAQYYCQVDPGIFFFYNPKIKIIKIDGQDKNKPANGADVALQQFKQLCIFKNYNIDVWFQYMGGIYTEVPLFQYINQEEGNQFMQSVGISPDVINQCVKGYDNSVNARIPMLNDQIAQQYKYGVVAWPAVAINDVMFRGTYNGTNIVEEICSTLINPSKECGDLLNSYEPNFQIDQEENEILINQNINQQRKHSNIIIVVIIVMFLLFLIVFYFYRRKINKQLKEEINIQVQTHVSQYIALHEQEKENKQQVVMQKFEIENQNQNDNQ